MSAAEQKGLKEQLRAMSTGRNEGIELDTPLHWVIPDLRKPVLFFEHLSSLVPFDSTLYIEGGKIAPPVATFYSANAARNPVVVTRDTIFPIPAIYHVTFSPAVAIGMRQFAESRSVAEMFDHLKAYRNGKMLFSFHDAFDGELLVADILPERTVSQFCRMMGTSCRHEKTTRLDPEHFRKILWALENHPERLKALAGESPWYKRAWKRLTGK